nr:stage III sporulation protein AE [Maliibacterium massiliense]
MRRGGWLRRALLALLLGVLLWPGAGALAWDGEEPTPQPTGEDAQQQLEEALREQADILDVSQMEQALLQMDERSREALGIKDFGSMMLDVATGRFLFDGQAFLQKAGGLLAREVRSNLAFITGVLGIGLICGLLQQLKDGLSAQGAGRIAYMACYALIMVLVMQRVTVLVGMAREVVLALSHWMTLLMPVLLLLLSTMGAAVSSGVFQPITVLMSNVVRVVMVDVMLPLTLSTSALTAVNRLGEQPRFEKMVHFLQSLIKWGLGITFTLFVGTLTIQGMAAASFDGLSMRTMKFTLSNMVPIVGSVVSDSLDTLIGCSMLLKNGVGITGVIIALCACLLPVMRIGITILGLRLCAAVLQPVSSGPVVQCLEEMSKVLQLLFSIVVAVAMMFFLAISLVVAAGNTAFMMR